MYKDMRSVSTPPLFLYERLLDFVKTRAKNFNIEYLKEPSHIRIRSKNIVSMTPVGTIDIILSSIDGRSNLELKMDFRFLTKFFIFFSILSMSVAVLIASIKGSPHSIGIGLASIGPIIGEYRRVKGYKDKFLKSLHSYIQNIEHEYLSLKSR